MKQIRFGNLAAVSWLLLALSACASLNIPAPNAPVKPLTEPSVPTSFLALPVTISLDSLLDGMGLSDTGKAQDGDERSMIARSLRQFLKRQTGRTDNKLLQNVYARRQAANVWDAIQRPIQLGNGLSLLLDPQELSLSPFTEQDGDIRFVIGLAARPKLTAGPVPAAAPRQLPEIAVESRQPETGFHIALETELSFDFLSRELTAKLEGRKLSAAGQSATVRSVRVYGSGESLVIALDVTGSVRGTVYLSGIPQYDEAAETLSLKQVDYTLETKQQLARAADWLLHADLRENLARRAVWPLTGRIGATKEMLTAALNRKISDHVNARGTIDSVRPLSVGLTASSIKAVLEADGAVELRLF